MLESDGPGGAETFLLNLAEELRARGVEAVPVLPTAGCGWLGAQFQERGFEPEAFVLRRSVDWKCVAGLREIFARRSVDVVHSHEFTMAVYGAAAARLSHLPHVITMHGNQGTTRRARRRIALRWAIRASSATVAVSRQTRIDLESKLQLRPGILRTILNGVPAPRGHRGRVRAELGLDRDDLLLVAVGNLIQRKGHHLLLEALGELRHARCGRWRLAIAGRGEEREALEDRIRTLGMNGRVHLLGHRHDVNDLLAAADVFVMPSLWEGLPLALLEAMLAGIPIVASSTCGIPEAIVHQEQGLLVEPGDHAALRDALLRVMEDEPLRRLLGNGARRRAQREFSVGTMADHYMELYRSGQEGSVLVPAALSA